MTLGHRSSLLLFLVSVGCLSSCGGGEGAPPPGGAASGGEAAAGSAASGSGGAGATTPATTGAGGGATGEVPAGGAGGGASTGSTGAGGAGTGGAGEGGTSAGGGGGAEAVAPGIDKLGEGKLAESGLTVVSYGGYVNGESFQQDAIVSFGGYQYTAFWNTNRNVVLARRRLPSSPGGAAGAWQKFDFKDHRLSADDAHNTISLGIAPGDGTLHLAFDHHGSPLHYRRSVAGLLTDPENVAWAAASFSAVSSALEGSTRVALVTYPRFVTEPGGEKLLLSARIGESGSGDEHLWEYDTTTHAWTSLGEYIEGTDASMNAYLHGLAYTRGGARLHAAWCWRDTPDPTTNHDLLYIYSDDHGRTWHNSAGDKVATTGASFVTRDTAGLSVWPIGQNRGLINQEHMAVDASGRVHVLLSHLPDGEANNANFTSARSRSEFFHYVRDTDGTWTRHGLGLRVIQNFRGKLAISSTENVYAILPDLRIAGASPSDGYATWELLDAADAGRFFSDPLIDAARLETSDELTVYYPERSSVNIWGLEYALR
ncbi:BNR repeat-containing protein [Sorangium sp. So ce1036]|uniref:BNR repeat-containing protein n=1 Tax=Sorangium sp. So ce1036 TaxID=3133328 RepID=UPI003EFE6178